MALSAFEAFDTQAKAKKNVRAAIEDVASRLGNTPTICRKCYVHPEVFTTYLEGALLIEVRDEVEATLRKSLAGLRPEEAAVLTFLEARLDPRDRGCEARARGTRAPFPRPVHGGPDLIHEDGSVSRQPSPPERDSTVRPCQRRAVMMPLSVRTIHRPLRRSIAETRPMPGTYPPGTTSKRRRLRLSIRAMPP